MDSLAAWRTLSGVNAGYLVELYERYRSDPLSVDEKTRAFFQEMARAGGFPSFFDQPESPASTVPGARPSADVLRQMGQLWKWIDDLRQRGHRAVGTDPLAPPAESPEIFDVARYGLSLSDMERTPSEALGEPLSRLGSTVRDVAGRLQEAYLGRLGIEFEHLDDPSERDWLRSQVEEGPGPRPLGPESQRRLLDELLAVEEFERYLHTTFPGQKRFSLEGLDVLVPLLNRAMALAAHAGVRTVTVGMAHRGRLNVLAHVFGRPYASLLAEFLHGQAVEPNPQPGLTGDVKYHLGYHSRRQVADGTVDAYLAHNPSHLEFVNPVVAGETRALQDDRSRPGRAVPDPDRALAVVVHGDAAFTGEGVVAETLNLHRLQAYQNGGTLHILANNGIGFTTDAVDERSTRYASDLARGYGIPVVHVNADDVEAACYALDLAFAYRQAFHHDFLIDLHGYRRWGHNEGDEPAFTQPQLYAQIQKHPTVARLYADRLASQNVVTASQVEETVTALRRTLADAHQAAVAGEAATTLGEPMPKAPPRTLATPSDADLERYNQEILSLEDHFRMHPKLARVLKRRASGLSQADGIDWAWAESLAFASLLASGVPIRMTGQDTERGTFSQRHLVLHDVDGGPSLTPLAQMPSAKASFTVHNSPLSETAVLGFEYGYSVLAPEALVIWEAQFGDFANVAQPILDQYLAAARAKWGQTSGLVLLLPHGYEGQGPEHSSARLERFLQLAAEDNLYIANCTTAGQYYHLLRLQAARLASDPRPLVIMAPKSLLRHPLAASTLRDLTEGHFESVLELPLSAETDDAAVERLLLMSGKVAIDLLQAAREASPGPAIRALRLESLYPFPEDALRDHLNRLPRLREVVWLQEEPANMGAWGFVAPRLRTLVGAAMPVRYLGRPERASVATGNADVHAAEQRQLLERALQYAAQSSKVQL